MTTERNAAAGEPPVVAVRSMDVLITKKTPAFGGFFYTGARYGAYGMPGNEQIHFFALEDHPLLSVVKRSPAVVGLGALTAVGGVTGLGALGGLAGVGGLAGSGVAPQVLSAVSRAAPTAPTEAATPADPAKGPTNKDRAEAADEAWKWLLRGGGAVTATELANVGGAQAAAQMAGKYAGVPVEAASVTALAQKIETSGAAAPGSDLWKILKLGILAITLFGLTPNVIRYLFGESEPSWIWPLAYGLDVTIILVAGLWVFDAGPFAPLEAPLS